ncbi:LacI family DNA-binding transcriptional regulator [Pseudactinotalea suaedae]
MRLVDVAAHAGVSMKTVSNVVHDNPHVSPAMRARVERSIDELGYRPNLTARRLATGRTGMLALALPEMDQPYYAELARHVAEAAPEFGYRVLMEQTLLSADDEHAAIGSSQNGVVDGILLHPVRLTPEEIGALPRDLPLVLLGESAPPAADHVMIDNVAAARAVIQHLVDAGRRRIAFLGTVVDQLSDATAPRLQGYHEGLDDLGTPQADRCVLVCADYSVEASEAALSRALADGLQIDAVMCREDRFAVGALRALLRAGRRVPEDVAVVGWDDTEPARWSHPQLSSVAPDKRALARAALRLLHERIMGYQGAGRHVLVPHRLVVRASSQPAGDGGDAVDRRTSSRG